MLSWALYLKFNEDPISNIRFILFLKVFFLFQIFLEFFLEKNFKVF